MTEVRIFESKKTLEVTKTFAKAASRYGSEAYMKLRSARNDFPDFKVVVRSTAAKKKDSFKGLTYAYMEKYILSFKVRIFALLAPITYGSLGRLKNSRCSFSNREKLSIESPSSIAIL